MMKVILATEDLAKKKFISEALDPLRYEVEFVEDAYTVIDKVEQASREQIVILDFPLPGMNGIQVCEQVARTTLRWRSLLLGIPTSHSSWNPFEFLKSGGDSILSWSTEGDDLQDQMDASARFLERQAAITKKLKVDAERYIPLEPIGSGGVSSVYRGIDRKLEREVAIKYLRSDFNATISDTEAALQEARLLAKFMHPNLVTVFDFGESEDGAFVVMEIVEGESLQSMLESGALRDSLFDKLVTQSLQGIDAAHALGVLHLDLKPSNMMFGFMASTGSDINLKIVDFGIARHRHQADAFQTLASKTIVGSIPYIAPERFYGEILGRRADLYALGHIYYIGLTGRHAFAVEGTEAMIDAHLNQEPPSIIEIRPDIPVELENWVMKLLAKKSADRFSSASEALQAYQKIKWDKKS
ncbi:MAG: protein kinase [Verrucomicrobiota bacterium]